jgi:hypothetical protein
MSKIFWRALFLLSTSVAFVIVWNTRNSDHQNDTKTIERKELNSYIDKIRTQNEQIIVGLLANLHPADPNRSNFTNLIEDEKDPKVKMLLEKISQLQAENQSLLNTLAIVVSQMKPQPEHREDSTRTWILIGSLLVSISTAILGWRRDSRETRKAKSETRKAKEQIEILEQKLKGLGRCKQRIKTEYGKDVNPCHRKVLTSLYVIPDVTNSMKQILFLNPIQEEPSPAFLSVSPSAAINPADCHSSSNNPSYGRRNALPAIP